MTRLAAGRDPATASDRGRARATAGERERPPGVSRGEFDRCFKINRPGMGSYLSDPRHQNSGESAPERAILTGFQGV